MSTRNGWLDEGFRRSIVSEGLVALREGRFREWLMEYPTRDEIYVSGELKYVQDLGVYVNLSLDHKFDFFDPRVRIDRLERFFKEFEKE